MSPARIQTMAIVNLCWYTGKTEGPSVRILCRESASLRDPLFFVSPRRHVSVTRATTRQCAPNGQAVGASGPPGAAVVPPAVQKDGPSATDIVSV